ncbi:tetratricopeptide repeat protein [Mangrovibacterium marinum]|uniref:Tetratricopeptide repeat protein n=1 Tax=Mangrovibacterium marinum TaxID=1639118 RepID=A0A2T5C2J9_9BACT|nr:tetratricopeptide repeat protein [Mangrovibacterium marinum]PTN08912.1 tetratricopeptide repeat protein [Mangrovibacterium marinum]
MNIKKLGYFALLGLTLASCATTKQQLEVAGPELTKSQETALTEDQKNEFEYLFIEGLKQKKLGNLTNAVSVFSRCLEIDPQSAVAMYEMGTLHYANKDLTSAALLLEKASAINPENKWYKISLAQVYQQRRQFSEAAQIYGELTELEPDNLEFLYSKAVLLGMAENYDEAIAAYNQLEAKSGLSDQISVAKQNLYLKMNQPDKAFAEINRLIESNPDEPQYYGLMAELYQQQGDKENALKYYNKILEIAPENGFVHFSLAGFYTEEGDFTKAFNEIKLAFANDELDADTKIQYYMMQTASADQSDWTDEQIDELLDILHDKYPDDNRMFAIYADHLVRQNKLVEARDYLKKYLDTDKSSFEIWWQYLLISNDLQDWKALYQDSSEAVELFPNQAALYALNAVAALQLDKYSEALEIIEQGETYAQSNKNLMIQLAIYKAEANYKLKHIDMALEAYDEVLKLDPQNFMAMNNYAYYLSVEGRDLEKAEKLSSKVVQSNPTNPTYLDTHAWVLFKRKDYSLAKYYIETALENGGAENATLIEHYGDILFMLGEQSKALEEWQKAQSLGDGSSVLEQKIKESRYIESKEE